MAFQVKHPTPTKAAMEDTDFKHIRL